MGGYLFIFQLSVGKGCYLTLISKDFCGCVLSWHRDANGRVISLLISDVMTKIRQIALA